MIIMKQNNKPLPFSLFMFIFNIYTKHMFSMPFLDAYLYTTINSVTICLNLLFMKIVGSALIINDA